MAGTVNLTSDPPAGFVRFDLQLEPFITAASVVFKSINLSTILIRPRRFHCVIAGRGTFFVGMCGPPS
jgi:hypothetical protein